MVVMCGSFFLDTVNYCLLGNGRRGEEQGRTRKKQSNVEMRDRVFENKGDSDHNGSKVKITEKANSLQ